MTVVAVTPNPAVDLTYRVPVLTVGDSARVAEPRRRAGGKGVNTASVLAQLGHPHVAVSAVGREVAAWWSEDLAARGIRSREIVVEGGFRTRSSVAVVDDEGAATVLNEQGEDPGPAAWEEVAAVAGSELTRSTTRPVLAICGSLAAEDAVTPLLRLVERARSVGAAVVVDGSGSWLDAVLPLRPDLVKPNRAEAEATTGLPDPAEAAQELVRRGARAAMVSAGPDGVVLVTGGGEVHRARPRRTLTGNPTGAGDAATAAACVHLGADGTVTGPEQLLRTVVGWSAAAVLSPLAGQVEAGRVEELAAGAQYARLVATTTTLTATPSEEPPCR